MTAPSSPPPSLRHGPIYLDYNATTPVDPRVIEAMRSYLTHHFGNPSSAHFYAERPRRALEQARGQVARLIGATPGDIVFTGSGSEANALAIHGVVLAQGRPEDAQVITQATEHPAVLEACRALQRRYGTEVTYLPVDRHGRVDPADLDAAMGPRTVLVSIMTANNETGVLQPVRALAEVAHRHGVPIHTDAAQAAGKIPLDAAEPGVDLLTVAGHKLYAPKGVGALYVRAGTALEPVVAGGGQERGLRAGTENIAFAVALGAAADLAATELAGGADERLRRLRDLLDRRLAEGLPGRLSLNGHPSERLPGTLNVSIAGTRAQELLAATPGIAAATGSACHSGTARPSPVLLAMGHDSDRAMSALRLTLGRWSDEGEVERAAAQIAATARRLASEPATTP